MPAILIVKGDDRIPVEQLEGERLLDKIRTLVAEHGADNVLLDGVPCSKSTQFEGATVTASDYDRGYADGLAAGKAEAAAGEPGVELGVGSDFTGVGGAPEPDTATQSGSELGVSSDSGAESNQPAAEAAEKKE